VSALAPLLTGNADARWIAAASNDAERAAVQAGVATVEGLDLRILDIDARTHGLHLDGFCNSTLWFLHHGLFDHVRRPRFDHHFRDAWNAYLAVNEQFADAIVADAGPREVVFVNDYHLALTPAFLRARRPDLRVLHFTHTPFCGADEIRSLPTDVAETLCGSLAAAPAGFHTERWADAFRASVIEALGSAPEYDPFVAPLGPAAAALTAAREDPDVAAARAALEATVGDRIVVARSDRIEPSKNLARGFLAFDTLLASRPDLRGRVVFVAMVYASRQGLAEYLAYTNEVEQIVDRVNERWVTADWQPIVLDARDDYSRTVAGLERYDVLLVNPLKDGLNLVAKEGPLLNQRDGVVCLSREAGAFAELEPAVEMVQPFDLDQTARALAAAIDIEPAERTARANDLRALAGARSPKLWLDDLLARVGS
jgi:trehalose 6-phosphate synthase